MPNLTGMEPITIIIYAVVCGCLSAVAAKFLRPPVRFGPNRFSPVRFGVGVGGGILAAFVLPFIQGVLRGY